MRGFQSPVSDSCLGWVVLEDRRQVRQPLSFDKLEQLRGRRVA